MAVSKLIVAGKRLEDIIKDIDDYFKVWFVPEEDKLLATIKKVKPEVLIASLADIFNFKLIREFYQGFILGVVYDHSIIDAKDVIDDFVFHDELCVDEFAKILARANKKIKMNGHICKIDNQIKLLSKDKKP